MNKHRLAAIVIVALSLMVQIFSGCGAAEKEAAWYQGVVDDFIALQPYEVPGHLQEENCIKNGTEFDVNGYFDVLTGLSLEPGYVLDYIYLFEWMGGRPVLYVKAGSQKPYGDYEEYYLKTMYQEGIDEVYGIVTPIWNEPTKSFEDKIRIDGSKEGFFQYVVLQVLGEQFYLFWHANYNDWRIVCEPDRIDAIVEQVLNSSYQEGIPPDFARKAKALDCKPVVEFNDNTAVVSVLIFTDWGGFRSLTYTIKRDYPHTIIDYTSETLLEYDCGIMF